MHGKSAFRIDLIDPVTREKTGRFPITSATEVVRERALDRIGRWAWPMAVTDPALAEIEGKDFEIYWQHNGQTHNLGQAQYLNHAISGHGRTVRVQAAGSLRDLQRQTVLQRSFNGATATVNTVLSTIVPLRAGWSLGQVDTVAKAAPMDFWYEKIYDGVALLASTFGQHFREADNPRTLDFGAFGQISGVIAAGGKRELPPEVYTNSDLCQIREIEVTYEGDRVVNRLIAFGGAVGVATIDLSLVTATQPGYAVQSAALPGGGSYYYLQDSASIAQYGLTEARFLRKDLRPISNSPASRQYAANILYEAALASLLNLKDRQTIYTLSVAGLQPGRVRVGEKIRVFFRGVAETTTGEQRWLDLDDDFYVLEMAESFGQGAATRLTINRNAVHEETVEDLLASTIRSFEQSQIHVQPTISRYTVGPYTKRVAASPAVSATFSFKLGLETLTVWYVKIQVQGEPLKSSVQSVSAQSTTSGPSSVTSSGSSSSSSSGSSSSTSSGSSSSTSSDSDSHDHDIQVLGIGAAGQAVYFDGTVLRTNGISGELFVQSDSHSHSIRHTHGIEHTHNIEHTHGIDHTHQIVPVIQTTYGIFQDSQSPATGNVRINGVLVASGISLANYELDITSRILAAASVQQEHTITVECTSGRGEITFQAQVLAVIQGIQVS